MNNSQTNPFDSTNSPVRYRSKLIVGLMILSVLVHSSHASNFMIRMKQEGTVKTNVCNVAVLSSYIGQIRPDRLFTAFEASDDVTNICPSLKYSCCTHSDLNAGIDELKDAFAYMTYRIKIIESFTHQFKIMAKETFKLFLMQLTSDDIQCYNKIQKKKLDVRREILKDHPTLLAQSEKNYKTNMFNRATMEEVFAGIKSTQSLLISAIKTENENRKKYYTSMLCSICSPMFYKYFRLNEDGKPVLKINKNHCIELLRQRYKSAERVLAFENYQKVTDLVLCAKKHSRKDRDYGNFTWEDVNYLFVDPSVARDYAAKKGHCIKHQDLFFLPESEPYNCHSACKDVLGLFRIYKFKLRRMIRAENDMFHMFDNLNNDEDPDERYRKKNEEIKANYRIWGATGILNKSPLDKRICEISFMTKSKHWQVDLQDSVIEVSNYFGINFISTPMNLKYIKANRILSILVLGLLLVLFL